MNQRSVEGKQVRADTIAAASGHCAMVSQPEETFDADSSGAVVIPEGQLDEVLAEARKIAADDERFRADIAREERGARPGR